MEKQILEQITSMPREEAVQEFCRVITHDFVYQSQIPNLGVELEKIKLLGTIALNGAESLALLHICDSLQRSLSAIGDLIDSIHAFRIMAWERS